MLHNMMVEHRVSTGDVENANFYSFDNNVNLNEQLVDNIAEDIERAEAEMALSQRINLAFYSGEAVNINEQGSEGQKDYYSFHHQCCLRRWEKLYDSDAHYKLQTAIIRQLIANKHNLVN
jgi:hypothetical protein